MASSHRASSRWFSPVSYLYQLAYSTASSLLSTPSAVPPERLLIQSYLTASLFFSAPTSVPPHRLFIQAFSTSFNILKMATSGFMNMRSIALPVFRKSKKAVGFLDLPINIKKKILSFNGDEQMMFYFKNDLDEQSFFTIGRDPLHPDSPAPVSLWKMALVCKQLFNEFFPVLSQLSDNQGSINGQRLIKETLFRHAVVNVRFIPDIYEVAEFLDVTGMMEVLPILRLWLICTYDAEKFFMVDSLSFSANDFVDGLEEHWPNLARLDVIPRLLPNENDTRHNFSTGQNYNVPMYDWILENVREADALPCLAERMWNDRLLWRSFMWSRTEYNPLRVVQLRDEYGLPIEQYERKEEEDEYY